MQGICFLPGTKHAAARRMLAKWLGIFPRALMSHVREDCDLRAELLVRITCCIMCQQGQGLSGRAVCQICLSRLCKLSCSCPLKRWYATGCIETCAWRQCCSALLFTATAYAMQLVLDPVRASDMPLV